MSTLIVRQLGTDGDLVGSFRNVLTRSAATAQKLRSRVRLIQAEWFLDPDAGVPWFALPLSVDPPIMGTKPADIGYAERTLKTTILETPGIASLTEFALTFDRAARSITVTATVTTDDGDIENIEVHVP